MNLKIITDSCCDLPLHFVEAHESLLHVIGMPIRVQDKDYIDDLGKSYDKTEFYNLLRQGIMPATSQINAFRFEEVFRKELAEGNDIVYLPLSSGMSGTMNSAIIGKFNALEDYPDRKIEIVDTVSASIGLGVLVVGSVRLAAQGKSAEEVAKWADSVKLKTQHWFGVDNLTYLKNGGRISSTSAVVGNVLNVKPTLGLDNEGRIKPYGNVRGRKKSIALLASKVNDHFDQNLSEFIIVGHGNCPDDASQLVEQIREIKPNVEIIVSELSMTIASHVGPDMIAVAFVGTERVN